MLFDLSKKCLLFFIFSMLDNWESETNTISSQYLTYLYEKVEQRIKLSQKLEQGIKWNLKLKQVRLSETKSSNKWD